MTPNLDETFEDLTPVQRVKIDECKHARTWKEAALGNYARAVMAARDEGVTYGILARELGVSRQSLQQLEAYWRGRVGVPRVSRVDGRGSVETDEEGGETE